MSLAALIAWSVRARHLVIAVTLLLALAGGAALRHTPLDALPNVAEPQVIVRTAYPGRTPEQVERDVGYPLATVLSAVPGVTAVRGVSMYGESQFAPALAQQGAAGFVCKDAADSELVEREPDELDRQDRPGGGGGRSGWRR